MQAKPCRLTGHPVGSSPVWVQPGARSWNPSKLTPNWPWTEGPRATRGDVRLVWPMSPCQGQTSEAQAIVHHS